MKTEEKIAVIIALAILAFGAAIAAWSLFMLRYIPEPGRWYFIP